LEVNKSDGKKGNDQVSSNSYFNLPPGSGIQRFLQQPLLTRKDNYNQVILI